MDNNQILLETKLVGDIRGSFFVPSYQRGYRWGEEEVLRLLDDIYSTEGKRNYCLQPVVVRKRGDKLELIDGQQRLTTIYLIYKYMNEANPNDQLYVKRLLPDSMGSVVDSLPILRTGEALMVGESVPLPCIVQIDRSETPPASDDIPYWTLWQSEWRELDIDGIREQWMDR